MKKEKTLLLIMGFSVVLGLSSCSSDDEDTPHQKYLAEITVKEYPWKFGERSTSGKDYESYKYDETGNLLRKKFITQGSGVRIPYTYDYSYDDRNRVIVMDEDGLNKYKYKYQYNEFDSVSVMQKYHGNDGYLISEYTYEYDNNKRLSKSTERNALLSSNNGYVRKYSYNGNTVTEVSTMLEDGSLFGTMVWEYDNHHNLLKETWTDKTGKSYVQKLNVYEYNTEGQLTKWTSKNNDKFSYRDYYYNEDGSIELIHLSYSFKEDKSDLIYTYTWK